MSQPAPSVQAAVAEPHPIPHRPWTTPRPGLVRLLKVTATPIRVGAPGEVRGGFSHAPGGWCE